MTMALNLVFGPLGDTIPFHWSSMSVNEYFTEWSPWPIEHSSVRGIDLGSARTASRLLFYSEAIGAEGKPFALISRDLTLADGAIFFLAVYSTVPFRMFLARDSGSHVDLDRNPGPRHLL